MAQYIDGRSKHVVEGSSVDTHRAVLVVRTLTMLRSQTQTNEGSLDLGGSSQGTSYSCHPYIWHTIHGGHTQYGSYRTVRKIWPVPDIGMSGFESWQEQRMMTRQEPDHRCGPEADFRAMVNVDWMLQLPALVVMLLHHSVR